MIVKPLDYFLAFFGRLSLYAPDCLLSQKSNVSFATTPERANRATRLGNAMSPFIRSAKSQTTPSGRKGPIATAATYSHL